MKNAITICWLRRDLRLDDNVALFKALQSSYPVLVVFVFDKNILELFEKPINAQVEFINLNLHRLQDELKQYGSSLYVKHGTPIMLFEDLLQEYDVKEVHTNEDYELSSIKRDEQIREYLNGKGVAFHSYKDHVIFAKNEILKSDGSPYTVFTPYSRCWKARVGDAALKSYDCKVFYGNFYKRATSTLPVLSDLLFVARGIDFPSIVINRNLIQEYDKFRDYPAMDKTSRLGIHLRFGTISIRKLASIAQQLNSTFLNELIWRDFYHAITWHFPHICTGKSFRKEYDAIVWQNDKDDFDRWCNGLTGYPIVDAGMRQLNETGFMHNRVRMIVASFLVKHLLIDWRWGETYFANKLIDFDFAANNGGWQWSSGSGCDAAPYFRIFNPVLQTLKFDKNLDYIHRWVPEYKTGKYTPIVDHKYARERVLKAYKTALNK